MQSSRPRFVFLWQAYTQENFFEARSENRALRLDIDLKRTSREHCVGRKHWKRKSKEKPKRREGAKRTRMYAHTGANPGERKTTRHL